MKAILINLSLSSARGLKFFFIKYAVKSWSESFEENGGGKLCKKNNIKENPKTF